MHVLVQNLVVQNLICVDRMAANNEESLCVAFVLVWLAAKENEPFLCGNGWQGVL